MQHHPRLMLCPCGCGRIVTPGKRGAHERRFATPDCRARYHRIARHLGEALLDTGAYTAAEAVAATARLASFTTAGRGKSGGRVEE